MEGNRLFVGGVSSDVQKDELQELFETHGTVEDCYVNPQGYAFVTFSDIASASQAVKELTGFNLKGRILRVEVSKPRGDRGGGGGGGRGGGYSSGGGGGGGGGYRGNDNGGSTPGNKLYIGGLAPDTTKEELEDAFRPHGDIENVWVATNPGGFGFVTYVDDDMAQKAVNAMNGVDINGQSIRVQVSRPKEGGGRGGGRGGGGGYGGGRGGGGGGGYGGGGGSYGGGGSNYGQQGTYLGGGTGNDDGTEW